MISILQLIESKVLLNSDINEPSKKAVKDALNIIRDVMDTYNIAIPHVEIFRSKYAFTETDMQYIATGGDSEEFKKHLIDELMKTIGPALDENGFVKHKEDTDYFTGNPVHSISFMVIKPK